MVFVARRLMHLVVRGTMSEYFMRLLLSSVVLAVCCLPALKDALPGEVSPGRVFSITSKEWGAVIAPELIRNKPLLGRLIDGQYASCNCLPEIVSLFTYSADTSPATISIAFAGSVTAKELFTPEYGYHS